MPNAYSPNEATPEELEEIVFRWAVPSELGTRCRYISDYCVRVYLVRREDGVPGQVRLFQDVVPHIFPVFKLIDDRENKTMSGSKVHIISDGSVHNFVQQFVYTPWS